MKDNIRPKYIYRYRDGRKFLYLAFWSGVYDELTVKEALAWKRKGVRVRDGDSKRVAE